MFSQVQAIAAAEGGAFLISSLVSRILDWYKASTGKAYASNELSSSRTGIQGSG